MRGQCSNCRHWIVPLKPVGRFGKPKAGHCREDGQLAHPGYSCARYRPTTRALLAYSDISTDELAWLRRHSASAVAMQLRQAWRELWHAPSDLDRYAAMNVAVAGLRAEIRARVLETEMSAGNPAGIDNEHTPNVRPTFYDHDPRS